MQKLQFCVKWEADNICEATVRIPRCAGFDTAFAFRFIDPQPLPMVVPMQEVADTLIRLKDLALELGDSIMNVITDLGMEVASERYEFLDERKKVGGV